MLDLPKRATELMVEVAEGQVKLFLEPLTDAQYTALQETADLQEDRIVYRFSRSSGLFEDRLRRVEGACVDGAEFDVANPAHLARLLQPWKAVALARLFRYANTLTEEERGNSTAPAEPSSTDGTPSRD